ncbi:MULTISPECIES: CitMHS family transporter [Pseudomonas]|jgi:CitMHS family citrate-Mg2+:H+ or citrate-Ca2+:H+ symporter|uniref:Citrate transporter n=1 Tax=Pseudomonas citronellolis TaxID=53408 RepID=A0A127N228_9PSED|nr:MULTISPECIES: CitMHS family transporter [Pseudomonas]KSW25092.1 citrate transporter [Pseudomonas sp. ADP]AMO79546.1 Citrate transporter [Pseudomonas citronellolis]ANI18264.1 citrate transporter [Pseudomonas citronellolis]KES23416.1 citrate transporter [Pseudomonas sp. AAC]KRV68337.1 citrate transporter [Pseudomonas citronellolis]
MLTLLAFAMVATFMLLIMTRRLSALIALILVPIAFALLGGFAAGLGPMMLDGIRTLAPTGVMLMFAILYFAIMIDSGLFDPAVRKILRLVKGDPLKVSMGTAALAMIVSLDGDGSTTYMICVAAVLPLYQRLGMSPLLMACLIMLSSGVLNMTPWGGPTARAASALHVDPADIFVPMIPAMVAGLATVFAIAWAYGKRERARLGQLHLPGEHLDAAEVSVSQYPEARRPKLLWFNGALTLVLMGTLIAGLLPMPVLFMIAFSIAMIVNYPCILEQKKRIGAHAENVLAVVSLIFAAGVFTGILSGTGMVEAMSKSLLAVIPPALGPYLATITALVSLPFTFFMSNDAFYYGVLPVLTQAAAQYGITPVEMARASIVGQPVHLLSPLVPSTYLLVGLAKVDFGDHQRFTLRWAVLVCLAILAAALLLGLFPLFND